MGHDVVPAARDVETLGDDVVADPRVERPPVQEPDRRRVEERAAVEGGQLEQEGMDVAAMFAGGEVVLGREETDERSVADPFGEEPELDGVPRSVRQLPELVAGEELVGVAGLEDGTPVRAAAFGHGHRTVRANRRAARNLVRHPAHREGLEPPVGPRPGVYDGDYVPRRRGNWTKRRKGFASAAESAPEEVRRLDSRLRG
jgi:hypothetical protein